MIDAIVGAGAAGLSLALMLGGRVPIYEKETGPGGLCRSMTVDGFTFDQGPHILGGIPSAVEWIVESSGVKFVDGMTRNIGYVADRFVPHPFDSHATGLQYMTKMWKHDPALLSVGGLSAQAGRKPGGTPWFRYPAEGGYQAITDAWAEQLDGCVVYGCEVAAMSGRAVWTTPTKERYNSLGLVTLGFAGVAPDFTAVYLPEPWTPFHRLSFPTAFSAANAPDGCWSVQGEASFLSGEGHPGDPVELLLTALDRLGFAVDDPVMMSVQLVPDAYPVPVAIGASNHGLFRHGRTGAHRYLNLDGVVAASHQLVLGL